MSQDEETPIEVTLGGVIDTLEHALTLSQESTPPAPAASETAAIAGAATTHRVQPSDTWESIAAAHGVDLEALYEANADQQRVISAGRAGVPVGAEIVIPSAPEG